MKFSSVLYLQTTQVTQGNWKEVMGDNPSKFKKFGDECPVEKVSWMDAQKFVNKLNRKEGIKEYRLPTEAEWEYACQSRHHSSQIFVGDDVGKLGEYAWYKRNSGRKTHPVASKKPNS